MVNVTSSPSTGFPLISITFARSSETTLGLQSRLAIVCGLAEMTIFTGSVLVNSTWVVSVTLAFATAVAVMVTTPTDSSGPYVTHTSPRELELKHFDCPCSPEAFTQRP